MDRALGEQIAQRAAQLKISSYDAAYVAGAWQLGAVLASCVERDLVGAGLAELPATLVAR